eukprot:15204-Eustigmatos_ZCMA.PRE.1
MAKVRRGKDLTCAGVGNNIDHCVREGPHTPDAKNRSRGNKNASVELCACIGPKRVLMMVCAGRSQCAISV